VSEQFSGKVAIVTGGGSGIGFAAARALAQKGVTAVLFGPDRKMLSSALKALQSAGLKAQRLSVRAD
jgi:NAD(P)-dependent dehydrogenase (short-subunit alcohol dehydrogenase family)